MRISVLRLNPGSRAGRQPVRRRMKAFHSVETLEDRVLMSLLGQQLFPSDNPWNQKIASAPVAPNSAAIINNIISLNGSNGLLHPEFANQNPSSNDTLYGTPINIVHGNTQPKVQVVIGLYPSDSDIQPAPIPADAVIQGDLQNGPTVGLGNRGDSHLIVYDVDNNVDYEFYHASRPSENSDGKWHADQETVWDMKTNNFRTLGWTSADAAGLAILPGLVRPDEGLPVSQGGQGVIDHAIRFELANSIILNQFLYPASHTANPGNTNTAIQPPMGARFRLKASVDISSLNPESRIIAQAMKDYGMIVADNGANFFFSGADSSKDANNQITLTWDNNDILDYVHGMRSLHFSDFEVVNLAPVVTGLSVSSGAAGSTVTVVGQNFAGASGHLQVLFGSTPATSATVVDDSHVTAVVPPGVGTVDVRVQSGVTTASNPSNYTNPIFGYGLSGVTTADRFTYSPATVTAGTPVNLGSSFNLAGIVSDGSTFSSTGGLDGGGAALSANLLGTSVSAGGNTFTIGAAGSNNVVSAAGQTIVLPSGNYASLQFLATAVNGNQANQKFTVTYTDGTTKTFTQSISDWFTPQNYAGESKAVTMPYRDLYNGTKDSRTFYVYLYSFALDPTKTIKSITLPNQGNVKILAIDLVS
jgi:IPT/TIG domain